MTPQPGPLETLGLSDPTYARICQRIRTDIMAGVFPPGHRLKIAELTRMYGVSQMPVREALQQLQGEWLVTISPNRGASVRQMDASFVGDLYDIRGQIEGMLTGLCAERASAEYLDRLSALVAAAEQCAVNGDCPGYLRINQEFHQLIYSVAGNVVGIELLGSHFGLLQSLRHLHGFSESRLASVITEHAQIMDALRRRDRALAVEAAVRHCQSAKVDLLHRMGPVR